MANGSELLPTAPIRVKTENASSWIIGFSLSFEETAQDTAALRRWNSTQKQMAEREGVTEQLKAQDQMVWVQRMNNIRNRAMEIVNHDLIYA